jgi:hypothetical protein
MRALIRIAASLLVASVAVACGAPRPLDARYPARPEGCDVKLFHESPTMQTDNLGPVTATCSTDVSDADCLRTLMDQACRLGGDVIWGVPERPALEGGKNVWIGRAAHAKEAPAARAPSR